MKIILLLWIVFFYGCESEVAVDFANSSPSESEETTINPPILDDIADISVNEGVSLTTINAADDGDDNDGSGNTITYQCKFDIVIDGAVSSPIDCTTLDGVSFDTSTGVFDWIPHADAYANGDGSGRYEFKIIGTSSIGSDDEIFVVTVNDTATFDGGNGVCVTSPFEVSTANMLDELRNYSDKCFIQTAHIDLNAFAYTPPTTFSGEYDGGNFEIRNWTDAGAVSNIGLFGATVSGTIQNVVLKDVALTGGNTVGAIAGTLDGNVTLENIYVTGDVSGTGRVGGIFGTCQPTLGENYTVTNVHFKGKVEISGGGAWIGGIGGYFLAYEGTISKVSVYGLVKSDGTSNVGGIVGQLKDEGVGGTPVRMLEAYNFARVEGAGGAGGLTNSLLGASIEHSVNRGDVVAPDGSGGIAYQVNIYAGIEATINQTISTGRIDCTDTDCGGVIGEILGGTPSVTDAFFDISATEKSSGVGIGADATTGYYMPQMKNTANFAGLDPTYWSLVAGEYPTLRWRYTANGSGCNAGGSPFGGGSGHAFSPYQICSLTQLEEIANSTDYEDKVFALMSNIDMTGTSYGMVADFKGVLQGNYFELSNWTFNDTSNPAGTYIGLFKTHTEMVVEDLAIDNFSITAYQNISLLSGFHNSSRGLTLVSNVDATNITMTAISGADRSYMGGILRTGDGLVLDTSFSGTMSSTSTDYHYTAPIVISMIAATEITAEVRRAITSGTISCVSRCAGIVASSSNGIISQVKSTMSLDDNATNSGNRVGGIIGHLGGTMIVKDAYFDGALDVFQWVGGIAGTKGNGGSPTISNAWVVADFTGSGTTSDGLIYGHNEGPASWSEVYGDTTVSTLTDLDGSGSEAGYSGQTTGWLQTAVNFNATWRPEIWDIQNGDYPRFTWE